MERVSRLSECGRNLRRSNGEGYRRAIGGSADAPRPAPRLLLVPAGMPANIWLVTFVFDEEFISIRLLSHLSLCSLPPSQLRRSPSPGPLDKPLRPRAKAKLCPPLRVHAGRQPRRQLPQEISCSEPQGRAGCALLRRDFCSTQSCARSLRTHQSLRGYRRGETARMDSLAPIITGRYHSEHLKTLRAFWLPGSR